MRYANIIINISHEAVDRPFTYIIPEELERDIHPGTRVMVPFGRGSNLKAGYCIAISDRSDIPDEKLKSIDHIVLSQDAASGKLLELASFIKEQYGSTMITALKLVLPVKKPVKSRRSGLTGFSKEDLDNARASADIVLNEEQQSVVSDFSREYDEGIRRTYLIHGITGSGKTEVYIEMIRHVVSQGKQAIVLIPEIALTYQTRLRFMKYFGDRVSIMNSTLAQGERYDHCMRAKEGLVDVVIGPRSALFTPFEKVGIIVIDEEHETTYKSENMPRYHAREIAIKLASMHNASVVLGSATPSIDSYYHAMRGDYKLYKLNNRALGGSLPRCEIVDLREELKAGNRSIFSRRLAQLLDEKLRSGQQAMLFLNRRGYAGFVSCRACGTVIKCPHCDVSMYEHRGAGRMVCHYCGYEIPIPKKCPKCESKLIGSFKAGTEQIENEVKRMFPNVGVVRMDADTTGRKGDYERILKEFKSGKAQVLIGTQMIVKGHDFPRVTLVGIIAADISLGSSDYRASERTFSLLTQAAGRAGRGELPGEVVIQTYQPDNFAIRLAATQDYEAFYNEEIAYRDICSYPPVSDILAVMITSKDEDAGFMLSDRLSNFVKIKSDATLIGPSRAGIGKINDYHRFVFYLKHSDMNALVKAKDIMEEYMEKRDLPGKCHVYFDFNPMNPF